MNPTLELVLALLSVLLAFRVLYLVLTLSNEAQAQGRRLEGLSTIVSALSQVLDERMRAVAEVEKTKDRLVEARAHDAVNKLATLASRDAEVEFLREELRAMTVKLMAIADARAAVRLEDQRLVGEGRKAETIEQPDGRARWMSPAPREEPAFGPLQNVPKGSR